MQPQYININEFTSKSQGNLKKYTPITFRHAVKNFKICSQNLLNPVVDAVGVLWLHDDKVQLLFFLSLDFEGDLIFQFPVG